MNVECFGQILDSVRIGQKLYIITQNKDKYHLISHHKGFDSTVIVAESSNLEFLHLILRQELQK